MDGYLVLMSVVDMPFPTQLTFDMPPIQTVNPQDLERRLEVTRHYLRNKAEPLRNDGWHVETLTEIGYPEEAIVRVARNHNVDAIIMSTHGRTGLNRLLLGSVTHRVLNEAPCPVFVIPNKPAKGERVADREREAVN
jgi:nucleotide-binding universal stress UspA family protein